MGCPDKPGNDGSGFLDVSLFDFDLPEELIALRPARPRDSARMLVVNADRKLEHAHVRDLPNFLRKGDALVVNDTKVIPARLRGHRAVRDVGEGAKFEFLLHKRIAPDRFIGFARPAKRLAAGDAVSFGELGGKVVARGEAGEVEIAFAQSGAALDEAIAREGEMPLPPYIAGKRPTDERDASDYQTTYAAHQGSVAAPTAGLHFTPELFARLSQAGVERETVTLHVGAGTFLPVTANDTSQHKMHSETASLDGATAARLNAAREGGGRIVAVGTTTLRTLESAAGNDNVLHAYSSDTDIFITPGYCFKTAEVLMTNFHLPRSTLFMLVGAFMGLDVMHAAYAAAIREHYRFYSYGDACLLLRGA
jgi:S-adenosylmethionine:tRNA ribosyltransferase-isomerase